MDGSFKSSPHKCNYPQVGQGNVLDVIQEKLEPVEYDPSCDSVDNHTKYSPQSHQCGFTAQSVQRIDESAFAIEGGIIGESM